MIRSTIILLLLLAIACRRNEPASTDIKHSRVQTRTIWQRTNLAGKKVKGKVVLRPNVLERCESGSQLDPDGLVSQPTTTFNPTDPIHLSMWIKQAPAELQLSMRVLDADENEIGIAHRDNAGGAKAVTMKVGEELKPGKYKLEGYWGGNLVCEKGIEVTK